VGKPVPRNRSQDWVMGSTRVGENHLIGPHLEMAIPTGLTREAVSHNPTVPGPHS
jgi:hypothetical protein